ncbi:MAG: IclR family transcriptional regulator [Haloarculaceae archaeon]
MERESKQVDAVKTSARVIDALADRGASGVTELADALETPKSTVHVHLSTLVEQGLVLNEGGTYRLSLRFLEIGGRVRSHTIFDQAKREVDAVADDLNELVNLMVEEDGMGVYIYSVRGNDAVDLDTTPGRHCPLNTTALGKAIMAHMQEERVHEIVDRYGLPARTEHTITDREELLDRLETIRERGYAYDDEENLRGVSCVAVPVVVERGVLGALSVSGPVSRMKSTDRIRERLQDAANVIEVNVEYN